MRGGSRKPATAGAIALKVLLGAVLAGVAALILAQRTVVDVPPWLELTRYMPFPVLLVPVLAALLTALRLGLLWTGAGSIVLLMVLTWGMGWTWGRPDVGQVPLRLMTYNVKAYKAVLHSDGFARLAREVALQRPDILVAQENHGGSSQAQATDEFPGGRPFGFPYSYVEERYIVASRFPLSGCASHALVAGAEAYYVRCLADVQGFPVDIVTVHLDSPREGLNAARREGLEGVEDWSQNYATRLLQARTLAADLRGAGPRLIVAGDLNAPESSPVVKALLALGLRDAYSAAGRGYGYSYGHALRVGFSFLRIDHVLVSPAIGVVDAYAGASEGSEHRPVIADLVLRRAAPG